MTIVIVVIIVLAIIVMGVIFTPIGHAVRNAPERLRASRPYRRPPSGS